jgi:hypothetical protein
MPSPAAYLRGMMMESVLYLFSHLAGVAGAAFISESWQPPSRNSAGDAAVRFGVTMGADMSLSVFKEFLPEIVSLFHKEGTMTHLAAAF